MSGPIRGVLFDKDGTLLDFERTWAPVSRACAERVAPDPAQIPHLLAAAGHDPHTDRFAPGSAIVAGTAVDVAEAFASVLGPDADVAALSAVVDQTFLAEAGRCAVPVDGLAEVILDLRAAGYVLGVATSDNTASAELGLATLGLREHFAFVCGYDAGHGGKPGPGMVHGFCAAVGLRPEEVVVVGDSTHDLEMGRAAGAGGCVGVLTGPARAEDLAALADVVLASAVDLGPWLAALR